MRRTRFDDAPCPIARTTDLIGDWWTPIVMREAFSGARRFGDFAERLEIPRAVLTARLTRLVDDGLLARVEYQQNPIRHEYRLTDKGRDFWGVLAAMWRWGSDHLWDDGDPPISLRHRDTGEIVQPIVVDEATGEPLDVGSLLIVRNPAATRTS